MAGEKSVAQERRVVGYPRPTLYALFMGYRIVEEQGKSEAFETILHNFFKDLPADKLAKYRIAFAQSQIEKPVVSWPV